MVLICGSACWFFGYWMGRPVKVVQNEDTAVYSSKAEGAEVWTVRLVRYDAETGRRIDTMLTLDRESDEVRNVNHLVTGGDTTPGEPVLDMEFWKHVDGPPIR